jgi:long-chain acyl-CoA synthetase
MREYSEAPINPAITTGNLADHVVENATSQPLRVVLVKRIDTRWVDVTAAQFRDEVVAVAKGLVSAGVQPGDRVALMSRTRYEWTLIDYAIWFAGAVTVPVYETSSAEQLEWILSDSGAVALFLESDKNVAVYDEVRDRITTVRNSWVIDDNALDELISRGQSVADDEIERRRNSLTPDSLATIIYTSGTTGRPKGCMLTHGNFMFEVDDLIQTLPELFLADGASTLMFLPLAHVFGRAIQVGAIRARVKLGHTADIKSLVADLGIFQPTFILAVPRVFEKVYNGAQQKAVSEGKGKIFGAATKCAIGYSTALDSGGPGIGLRLQHAIFDRLVYGKLRAAMGGKITYAVSGGAPLGARLGHFYRGIGITILEGYGLTETSAGMTINRPHNVKIGTVGSAIPGSSMRIADDGEVLMRGGNVFTGYWQNETATAESIDADGWFHSGDVGELDDDGYLKITGRKKELIVTAGGKNVAPAVLEDRLRSDAIISQCMVVGDAKPYIAALVTIDPEAWPAFLKNHELPAETTIESMVNDPTLIATVQTAVDHANKAVSNAEAIKRFRILSVDWTEEGGQLTPSLKLKRNVVNKDFSADLEALYS